MAFLDLLGFSQASTATANSEESQQTLNRIAAAIQDSREFTRQSVGDDSHASAWGLKFFSDNLVLALPLGQVTRPAVVQFVIRCVQHYQLRMALNGLFLRGALTMGAICLTDEIIFGPALVEGYRLESKVSIVPRVLITEPLLDVFRESRSDTDSAANDTSDMICRDVDGWWFVNYLNATQHSGRINWGFIERHKQSILQSLSSTTRHDVLPKFGWACRYHNVFCHWHRNDVDYADRYRIDRVDEQSTIYRPGDTTPFSQRD